jgi:hypothetical protein
VPGGPRPARGGASGRRVGGRGQRKPWPAPQGRAAGSGQRAGAGAAGPGRGLGRGARLRHKGGRAPRGSACRAVAAPLFLFRARPGPCTLLAPPWPRSPGTRTSRSCRTGTASTSLSSTCATFSKATRSASAASGARAPGGRGTPATPGTPAAERGPGPGRTLSLRGPWSRVLGARLLPAGGAQSWSCRHAGTSPSPAEPMADAAGGRERAAPAAPVQVTRWVWWMVGFARGKVEKCRRIPAREAEATREPSGSGRHLGWGASLRALATDVGEGRGPRWDLATTCGSGMETRHVQFCMWMGHGREALGEGGLCLHWFRGI